MRKKLKTSSRKPENVIKFGASQVGKIYGKAAKEQMNSLKHGLRSKVLLQPWLHWLGVRQRCQEHPEHPGAAGSVGLGCRDSGIRGMLQAAPHSLVAPQRKQLMVLQS